VFSQNETNSNKFFFSFSGYVEENSDIGTKVTDENGKEIVFVVNDADKVRKRQKGFKVQS
jgi:hypothetical protein